MKRSCVSCWVLVGLTSFVCVSGCLATETDEQLWEAVAAALKQKAGDLNGPALDAVAELVRRRDGKAKEARVIDALVSSGANCLDDHAGWTDPKRGRIVYDTLKGLDSGPVTESLARHVLKGKNRLRVLFLGVKLGIPGSETRLNQILLNHGNKSMAEDFLNSGSQALFDGGKSWANAHGYSINTGMGSHRVSWGSF